jgi:pimeloyl-ACP methyl ester carboxylesterase
MPHTFVLVHGAWHGGWCWRRVADLLAAKGHRVFTPTLTGLGERSHLMSKDITLTTHVTDVVNVFKWEGLTRDVVLCGHSYGGFVVSGVAEQMASAIGWPVRSARSCSSTPSCRTTAMRCPTSRELR